MPPAPSPSLDRPRSPSSVLAAVPARWRTPLAVLLVACAAVFALGPLRARVRPWNDFAFVFAAGRTWLEGFSPYDFDRWNAQWEAIRPADTVVSQPMPYMYPPHWAPIALAFAGLPWPVASRLWDVVNIAVSALTVLFCVELLGIRWRDAWRQPGLWAALALAMLNPALRYSLWQSQMTVVTTFGLVGAFWAWQKKKLGWLAAFSFVAALKPQLSALGLFYLLINGGHLGVLLGGACAAIVGLVSLVPSGLGNLSSQYAHCYALHMQLDFNDPKNFSNFPALFGWEGMPHAFMPVSAALAVGAAVALTIARRRDALRPQPALDCPLWQLAIVAAITAAFMPVHSYDLVLYAPIVLLAYNLRDSWLGPLLVVLVIAGRPGAVTKHLHVANAAPYLALAVLGTLVAAAVQRYRGARPPREEPAVATPAA